MDRRDQDRVRMFGRRAALVAGGQMALFAALAGRMYYLQVLQADRYAMLADENRINLRLLAPPRGLIFDRFGVPVAVNQHDYQVLITSEDTPDVEAMLDRLTTIVPISADERKRILRDVARKRAFVPVSVKSHLSWDQVARIEVSAPELPGIGIQVGQLRHYPFGADASHVLGYVGAPALEDQTGDPLLTLPNFRIGKSGMERQFERALRGAAGRSHMEVNALGREIRELDRREGTSGHQLVLTLDAVLQRSASQRLGEESGAVVVLDVRNGDILTLASSPGYDPNAFSGGITHDYWRSLIDDERAPLRNKAIAGEYAPGSTFKIVVALAALAAGVVDRDTPFYCNGKLRLGDGLFHCWKRGGHGPVELLRGIRESCDVYFYEVAKRVGIDRIAAMAEKLGLGQKLDPGIPGERPGLIPTKSWKQAVIGQVWTPGETLVAGIGQGYVLTTPLQLALMTARVVNGGRAIRPRLTRVATVDGEVVDATDEPPPIIDVEPRHLATMIEGMAQVTQHQRGTARRSRIDQPGMEMGGKTGTSQVRRITRAERLAGVVKNEDLPWKRRDHALFIAFAPIAEPRYAVAVVIEHGGGGSTAAAPIAHDVMVECLERDPGGRAPGVHLADADARQLPPGG